MAEQNQNLNAEIELEIEDFVHTPNHNMAYMFEPYKLQTLPESTIAHKRSWLRNVRAAKLRDERQRRQYKGLQGMQQVMRLFLNPNL